MTPFDDLICAIAIQLKDVRDFGAAITERKAAEIFHAAAYRGHCPHCDSLDCAVVGSRWVECSDCRRVHSLTASSPIRRTKIALREWLAATWHIHVSDRSISACGFTRRYGMREMTAWNLLRRVRGALPRFVQTGGGARAQVLGKQAPSNHAEVSVAIEDGALIVLPVEDVSGAKGTGSPANALFLGHLKAWLTHTFRGVSKTHLWLYLAEFADRYWRPWPGEARKQRRP